MQERIQRMLDGHESHSPAWRWLGLRLLEAEPGRTLVSMRVTEEMRNHGGVCHARWPTRPWARRWRPCSPRASGT